MAAGSCKDLDKSEHEREATCQQLLREIDTKHRQRERSRECEECSCPKGRDLIHGRITGDEHGPALKHLHRALPVSVLTQRSDALREAGPTNVDTYTHQSALPHLLSSNPPLRLHAAQP